MIPRLVIATKNRDKLAELDPLVRELGIARGVATGMDWPDVDETGATLEENAFLKARAASEATGLPALGDDTGLEVGELGGAPGIRTARYAGPDATYQDNVSKLLTELGRAADRSARFRTAVVVVWPDGSRVTAEGHVDGEILERPRGVGGFGYDPVFAVDGLTLAEMSEDAKNQLSHRYLALRALAEKLS